MDLDGPFLLPLWFDYGATFIWAITGSLIAARRGYDIAGIAALALVSATGGGLLRDGIFLQDGPPLFLRTWVYMALVVVAASAVSLAGTRIQRIPLFEKTIAVVDALGLGGFAITGLQLSLAIGLSAPAAAFVGVVNAVGGGVLRDLLLHRDPEIFRPGPPAALAALAGCVIYLGLLRGPELGGAIAGTVSVLAVFFIRIAALRYGWRTRAPRGFENPDDRDTDPGLRPLLRDRPRRMVACTASLEMDLSVTDAPKRRPPITEAEATRLAWQAVDLAGGASMIYRNPRQPFSPNAREVFTIDGHPIEVRWGEISSPAIVTAAGYVFEILDEGIELLVRPPKPKAQE